MRLVAIGFSIATLAIGAWLIVANITGGTQVGMNQLLRPEGNVLVKLLLGCFLGAILCFAFYLSDTVNPIEVQPTGPFDVFSVICGRVAMMATAAIVIVMSYEVVSRYVFERPTLWANELSLWIAGFVFLLAGLYAMQQRSHIRIYIIYDMFPRWMQKLADCISVFLIWVFAFALVWGGFNEAKAKFLRMETFGTAWDPPLPGTIKPAILLIICLVALQALSNLIADWNKAPEHHSPADDIDEDDIAKIRKTLGDIDNG
ncbi:MAG: TRAP transporter small permease [Rhodobacteraceae bacterium]|nr:TRAP transporter small permease [Paracoccaceae bacterium]